MRSEEDTPQDERTGSEREAKSWKGRLIPAVLVALVIGLAVQSIYLVQVNGKLAQIMASEQGTAEDEGWTVIPRPDRDEDTRSAPQDSPSATVPTPPIRSPLIDDPFSRPFDPFGRDPFQEMARIREEMDRLFSQTMNRFANDRRFSGGSTTITFSPRINVKDEGDHYLVTVDLPGASESDLSVEVEGSSLTVRAKRDTAKEDQSGGTFLRHERIIGEFARTEQLPGPVDESGIETRFENGVLTVKLPKAAETRIQARAVR